MKLAIAQMVFGVVIAGISAVGVFWIRGYEPTEYARTYSVLLVTLYSCMCISGTLSVAVLGCGIAQYLKARG